MKAKQEIMVFYSCNSDGVNVWTSRQICTCFQTLLSDYEAIHIYKKRKETENEIKYVQYNNKKSCLTDFCLNKKHTYASTTYAECVRSITLSPYSTTPPPTPDSSPSKIHVVSV